MLTASNMISIVSMLGLIILSVYAGFDYSECPYTEFTCGDCHFGMGIYSVYHRAKCACTGHSHAECPYAGCCHAVPLCGVSQR
jgi:hypothetical protein